MKWIDAKKEQPAYETRVLGFVYCTCGAGKESEVHKLSCSPYEFFIAKWNEKDHQAKSWYDKYPEQKNEWWKYEDSWSPYDPDFWMHLPEEPK